MSELVIPKETARALRELTGEARPEAALRLVLNDARAYRLEKLETEIRPFEARYGMTFDEYRAHFESDESAASYSWEAERDFLEWEGLMTRRRQIEAVAIG